MNFATLIKEKKMSTASTFTRRAMLQNASCGFGLLAFQALNQKPALGSQLTLDPSGIPTPHRPESHIEQTHSSYWSCPGTLLKIYPREQTLDRQRRELSS